ncbi:MAG: efflux RND transporter periplasmic adaptor subunit [Phycisphaeraceae bacterium]
MITMRNGWKQRLWREARPWLIGIGATVALAAAFGLGLMWSGGSEAASGHDHAIEQVADESGEATQYYCPMHPHFVSDDPDEPCPYCGMALSVMPDGNDDGAAPILRLSDRSMALLNVQVTPAEQRPVDRMITFVGELEADTRRRADVAVRSESYIETLHADYQWKRVAEGEVLAEVYSPDVLAAGRELLIAHRNVSPGEQTAGTEAAWGKLRRLGLDDASIGEIVQSGDVPRTQPIRSPIAGVVSELDAAEGQWLNDGQRLLRVMDLSTLWLQLEAFESDLAWVGVGSTVTFEAKAQPGRSFDGEVSFVEPIVDRLTRTAKVRVDVPNAEAALKPGMYVSGEVHAEGEEAMTMVPRSAVLMTGRRGVVYVQLPREEDAEDDRTVFEGRLVVLGPRSGDDGDWQVIHEGIEPGEMVVTNGNFKLDSELQIRPGAPSMMSPPGAAPSDGHQHHGQADGGGDGEQVPMAAGDDRPDYWPSAEQLPVDDAFAKQVGEVVQAYFALTEAMAADAWDEVGPAIDRLDEQVAAVDAAALDDPARQVWQRNARRITSAITQMRRVVGDEKSVRRIYVPMSEAMIDIVARLGAQGVGPIYLAHCPMAIEDTHGAEWVQAGDEVDNPYMGTRMRRCGSVAGQLNALWQAAQD